MIEDALGIDVISIEYLIDVALKYLILDGRVLIHLNYYNKHHPEFNLSIYLEMNYNIWMNRVDMMCMGGVLLLIEDHCFNLTGVRLRPRSDRI